MKTILQRRLKLLPSVMNQQQPKQSQKISRKRQTSNKIPRLLFLNLSPPKQQKRHFIFGYGSLINALSRQKTVRNWSALTIPVKVQGLQRSWSYACPVKKYTAVSVHRTFAGKSRESQFCNGVLVELPDADSSLPLLDKRELMYERSQLDLKDISLWSSDGTSQVTLIQSLSTSGLVPEEIVIWVYQTPTDQISLRKQPIVPSSSYPIPQTYVDCILQGCLNYGTAFAQEFLKSTSGWCRKSWLNDRRTQHQKLSGHGPIDFQTIDALIQKMDSSFFDQGRLE
jgi:hypothetical protein